VKRARMVQVAAACVGLSAAAVIGGTALASHGPPHQLEVCCAWNSSLADGDLTYRVAGADSTARDTVKAAIEAWDTKLVGLTLSEVVGKTAPNIDVKFKPGGGVTQGLARRSFDRAGFVRSVKLTISGSAFGNPNNQDTIGEIARHEMGHALGLGHANFDDLMDPTVGGANEISACDIAAVKAANHWILVDPPPPGSSPVPHAPHVTHVEC